MSVLIGEQSSAADYPGHRPRICARPVDGRRVGTPTRRRLVRWGMRTDDAMYMLIHGYNDMVFATAHYFDDRDPSTETEAWQNWLGGLTQPR